MSLPDQLGSRLREGFVVAVLAAGLLLAIGGYAVGRSTGPDLDQARAAGQANGAREGRALGRARGYRSGFNAARAAAGRRSYRRSYRRGCREAIGDAATVVAPEVACP